MVEFLAIFGKYLGFAFVSEKKITLGLDVDLHIVEVFHHLLGLIVGHKILECVVDDFLE